AAAALCKPRRLRLFRNAQRLLVETPGFLFPPRRHRELYVINADNAHLFSYFAATGSADGARRPYQSIRRAAIMLAAMTTKLTSEPASIPKSSSVISTYIAP